MNKLQLKKKKNVLPLTIFLYADEVAGYYDLRASGVAAAWLLFGAKNQSSWGSPIALLDIMLFADKIKLW